MSKKKDRCDQIDSKLLDDLLKSYEKPEDLLGDGGIFKKLQKKGESFKVCK